jgi:hypothetical protein
MDMHSLRLGTNVILARASLRFENHRWNGTVDWPIGLILDLQIENVSARFACAGSLDLDRAALFKHWQRLRCNSIELCHNW